MGRLMMLAENCPQLKSDGAMIEAQRTSSEIETNIAAAHPPGALRRRVRGQREAARARQQPSAGGQA